MKVQSSTVEEKFMFGSPPLLNGFTYNSCRSQEGVYNNDLCSYQTQADCTQGCVVSAKVSATEENSNATDNLSSTCAPNMNGDARANYGYSRSFQTHKNVYRNAGNLVDNFNNLSVNSRTSHVDNGIKILEQAGIKFQHVQNEPVFKKRKDLRVLKSVLSNERFREVVMKFGDGDEGGKEIIESVHKAMKKSALSSVSCLFCAGESLVYDNFPVVDGTLFLTPVRLSHRCINFSETTSVKSEQYMAYVCVKCMEGKTNILRCSSCAVPWNGSFFQIGTLYSYNILSSMPCCQQRVSCNKCHGSVIDLSNGEASNLFFSYFSKKASCPHCHTDDFHFVKSLATISER